MLKKNKLKGHFIPVQLHLTSNWEFMHFIAQITLIIFFNSFKFKYTMKKNQVLNNIYLAYKKTASRLSPSIKLCKTLN